MKITVKNLKRVIKEALEDDVADSDQVQSSLDDQVDKYFGEYENDAKDRSKNENFDFRRFLREDDNNDTNDDTNNDNNKKLNGTSSIDVANFTNSVIRLVENYDSLLEVKNTILRRAEMFLSKNYDGETVDKFKEVLVNDHGVEIGKSKEDTENDNFGAPAATGAGPELAGSGGA